MTSYFKKILIPFSLRDNLLIGMDGLLDVPSGIDKYKMLKIISLSIAKNYSKT